MNSPENLFDKLKAAKDEYASKNHALYAWVRLMMGGSGEAVHTTVWYKVFRKMQELGMTGEEDDKD